MYIEELPGRIAKAGEVSYLFFSGFAYLGMPSLPEFQEKVKEGLSRYGSVFPSSRVSNTRNRLFDVFEEELSDFTGWRATASFSSGYLAAEAAVKYAAEQGAVFGLKNTHPSLLNEKVDSDSDTATAILEKIQRCTSPCAIVLESVHPLKGEVTRFDWLKKIRKQTLVIIDDSHGIGILGDKGMGVKSLLPQSEHLRYLVCYSLSKAFSCEGGAVSGNEEDIYQIKAKPPFTAAAPMSPAYVYAWMHCSALFEKQLGILRKNIHYFADCISDIKNIHFDERLPVCYIPDETLYERALKSHILLSSFRYPTADDPVMNRAVLNALHTHEDIDKLAECIRKQEKS